MKLVELLVKELEEWPEGVTYFVQDGDREVKAGCGFGPIEPTDSGRWVRQLTIDSYNFYSDLCTDWKTSVVTKDVYTKHKETQMKRKGHAHAELMAQYAEDAKTSKTPWEFWEFFDRDDGWTASSGTPGWYETTEYRRKPKTHMVHGVEIPDLRVSLGYGTYYYLADPTERDFTCRYLFHGDTQDSLWFERGLTYQDTDEGKQAACLHAKAMLGIA